MCWNERVSLNTFLFGAFAISLGLLNSVITPAYAIFYMSFISMQLIEYFLWKHLNHVKINEFWSKIGLALILVQPIAAILTIGVTNPVAWIMVAVYIAFLGFIMTAVKPFNTIDFSSERASNGHLRWNWLKFPLWAIIIWMGFLFFNNLYKKQWVFALINFALITAIYITYINSGTWGSLWCWIANIISVYVLWLVFAKDVCKV